MRAALTVADEIIAEAKQLTRALHVWMVEWSADNEEPRLLHAPKKIQAPLVLPVNGLMRWVADKKAVVAWLPRGRGHFLMTRHLHKPARVWGRQLKTHLDADMLWLGGYQHNQALLFLPLKHEGIVRHVLVLEAGHWTVQSLLKLNLLSRLASQALGVVAKNQYLKIQLQQAGAISEIAQNMNTTLELDVLLRLIALEINKAMHSQATVIWLQAEKGGPMTLQVVMGLSQELKAVLSKPFHKFRPMDHNQPVMVDSLKNAVSRRRQLFHKQGFEKIITLPLTTKKKIIGLVELLVKWPREPSQGETDLLRTLANLAATAIENTRLYNASLRKAQELMAVHEVSQLVSEVSNMESALGHIVGRVSELLEVEKAWFMFFDEERQYLKAHPVAVGAVQEQLDALQVPLEKPGISAPVFQQAQAMFSNDAQGVAGMREEFGGIFELKNFMAVPLRSGDETMGVFLVGNKHHQGAFTGHDVRLFKTLAAAAATVIKQAKLYDRLQRSNLSLVKVISKMIDAREPYTRGHSQRVAVYAQALARHLNLSPRTVEIIHLAGLVHDIGKLGTGVNLKLSADDRARQAPHVVIGEQMLQDVNFPLEVKKLVRHHHEHMDGSGSPDGLKGEDIPLGARIIAVADAFDVAANRHADLPLAEVEGFAALQRQKATRLDVRLVEAFQSLWPIPTDKGRGW